MYIFSIIWQSSQYPKFGVFYAKIVQMTPLTIGWKMKHRQLILIYDISFLPCHKVTNMMLLVKTECISYEATGPF